MNGSSASGTTTSRNERRIEKRVRRGERGLDALLELLEHRRVIKRHRWFKQRESPKTPKGKEVAKPRLLSAHQPKTEVQRIVSPNDGKRQTDQPVGNAHRSQARLRE